MLTALCDGVRCSCPTFSHVKCRQQWDGTVTSYMSVIRHHQQQHHRVSCITILSWRGCTCRRPVMMLGLSVMTPMFPAMCRSAEMYRVTMCFVMTSTNVRRKDSCSTPGRSTALLSEASWSVSLSVWCLDIAARALWLSFGYVCLLW